MKIHNSLLCDCGETYEECGYSNHNEAVSYQSFADRAQDEFDLPADRKFSRAFLIALDAVSKMQ